MVSGRSSSANSAVKDAWIVGSKVVIWKKAAWLNQSISFKPCNLQKYMINTTFQSMGEFSHISIL